MQYYEKIKNCLFFVLELPKHVQKNKIDDDCYGYDDDDIIYSPEKPISLNSNNVSK